MRLVHTPLFFADALVAAGEADGCVAGAVHTTGDVLRAALWIGGHGTGGSHRVERVLHGRAAVPRHRRVRGADVHATARWCRYPTATQLADIAIAAAADRRRIVGDEPLVAFLSFSTRGSAGGTVRRSRCARRWPRFGSVRLTSLWTENCKETQRSLSLVAARKAPDSAVAGRANVLVFPSLDAGNIAYKLVQRLAGASAVGPIVQGLRRPCSDLSRGAVVDDIINVAAITALQIADAPVATNESRQESTT